MGRGYTSHPIEDGKGSGMIKIQISSFSYPLLRWESQFDDFVLRGLPVSVFVLLGTGDMG